MDIIFLLKLLLSLLISQYKRIFLYFKRNAEVKVSVTFTCCKTGANEDHQQEKENSVGTFANLKEIIIK